MSYRTVTTRSSKPRSGIALGGIGAGWFELRQDGICYDWNIFNNKPLGTGPAFPHDPSNMLFFLVRYQQKGGTPKMRLLQIENKYGAGSVRGHEHYYIVPWMSGVDCIEYEGSFPFVRMRFTDKDMPFIVELEAFSPFIPHDVKNSSLPAAMFTFTIISKTKTPVDVLLVGSMRDSVAWDVPDRVYSSALRTGDGWKAAEMSVTGVAEEHTTMGTMALGSLSPRTSYYLGWEHHHPYYELLLRNTELANLDDTSGRSSLDRATGKRKPLEFCNCSVGVSARLTASSKRFSHTFVAAWHFPNLYGRDHGVPSESGEPGGHIEGHYYSKFFDTAADVVGYVAANATSLRSRTRAFHDSFFDSSAPAFVLDQVNSHLNTFLTSSWLTREGHFGILEGLNSYQSYAGLCTTDVAMYGSVSYASLFPSLARDMMEVYAKFQGGNGKVAHSIGKSFNAIGPGELDSPRLDMPGQFAFMALRDFFWSGDRVYLERVWPSVKKAIEYVLRERDMNGDSLPDMEGVMCSYDNFPMFGVASFVASQFLAAVQAAEVAAGIMGDTPTQERFAAVLSRGSAVFEERLWNGRYYRLCNDQGGKQGGVDEGCLTDQMIGQWASHQIGLGYFLDRARVQTAMKGILEMNFKPEYGLRNCQWPGDGFVHEVSKDTWIDQANTVWTGVELGFAAFLLQERRYADAIRVIRAVDDRYRHWGMYWDHQEFGGHYFRPMSAWGIVNAIAGLSIRNGVYGFGPRMPGRSCRLFFAFCDGYGHVEKRTSKAGEQWSFEIESGEWRAHRLELESQVKKVSRVTVNGRKAAWGMEGGRVVMDVAALAPVRAGKRLRVEIA